MSFELFRQTLNILLNNSIYFNIQRVQLVSAEDIFFQSNFSFSTVKRRRNHLIIHIIIIYFIIDYFQSGKLPKLKVSKVWDTLEICFWILQEMKDSPSSRFWIVRFSWAESFVKVVVYRSSSGTAGRTNKLQTPYKPCHNQEF